VKLELLLGAFNSSHISSISVIFYSELGSPWENGYNESFNGKFRDELLNGEIFSTLMEVQILTER
jgi:putative transposase